MVKKMENDPPPLQSKTKGVNAECEADQRERCRRSCWMDAWQWEKVANNKANEAASDQFSADWLAIAAGDV